MTSGASSRENAVAPETMPHVTMMRAIHIRAPTFSRMMLLGTSASTYPQKNMPAAMP